MKLKGVIAGFLLLSMLVLAFNVPQAESLNASTTEWARTYGIDGNSQEAYSLIQTDDGGYALLGYTRRYFAGWVCTSDFWFVKTDSAGIVEWNKTYGAPGTMRLESGKSIIQTNDGGYALAGNTGVYLYDISYNDFWFVKTDSMGNMQWNKTYGGADADLANSVIQTGDGGYAIAGSTYSYGEGYGDAYLVKTDSNGNMQWNKTYGGASSDTGACVVLSSDGGYVIVGQTRSYGAGDYDVLLIKTDSAGNHEWNKTYGGAGYDHGDSVMQTSEGGYVLVGTTESFGAGESDFWLIKIDSLGNMLWSQTYGGVLSDKANSLVQTKDGGYALLGWTASSEVPSEYWLVKTDSAGNMQWNQTYGKGNLTDYGYALVQTVDHGYVMAGSSNYYVAPNYAVVDFWLVKTRGGDVNGDGLINAIDLRLVTSAYGSSESEPDYNPDADLNGDGRVDMRDISIVARNLGKNSGAFARRRK